MRNQTESLFLRLPLEVRLIICKFVLCDQGSIPVPFAPRKQQACVPASIAEGQTNAHALLAVSRKIHMEARALPYSSRTFHFVSFRPKEFSFRPKPIAMDWVCRLQLQVTLQFHFQDRYRSNNFISLVPPAWMPLQAGQASFLNSFQGLRYLDLAIDMRYTSLDLLQLYETGSEHESAEQKTKQYITQRLDEFVSVIKARHGMLRVTISKHSSGMYWALMK